MLMLWVLSVLISIWAFTHQQKLPLGPKIIEQINIILTDILAQYAVSPSRQMTWIFKICFIFREHKLRPLNVYTGISVTVLFSAYSLDVSLIWSWFLPVDGDMFSYLLYTKRLYLLANRTCKQPGRETFLSRIESLLYPVGDTIWLVPIRFYAFDGTDGSWPTD